MSEILFENSLAIIVFGLFVFVPMVHAGQPLFRLADMGWCRGHSCIDCGPGRFGAIRCCTSRKTTINRFRDGKMGCNETNMKDCWNIFQKDCPRFANKQKWKCHVTTLAVQHNFIQ